MQFCKTLVIRILKGMEKTRDLLPGHDSINRIKGGEFALFATLLTAAMAVRLWNISWGLPDVFEEATPFTVARHFWGVPGGSFTLLPEFYHYPSLSFYIHFIVQAIYYVAGALTGEWASLDAFRTALASDPGAFMTGARLTSALFDVGTVGLVWYTAREHFGPGIAIGAALLVAFNPLQIEYAQGVNVDVLLTFFLVLAVRTSLALTGHSGARDFALAGALIGLAASTKYTGALFLAVPVFAVGADFIAGTARTLRLALREIALALLVPIAAAAVFALLNPGIFLEPQAFLVDFGYERFHMEYGHLGLDPGQGSAAFYLVTVLGGKLGLLFIAGAIAGIVVSAAAKNAGGLAIAAMAAIYVVIISTWEMHADRYILPAVPLLAILCSAGCVGATRWAAVRATDTQGEGKLRTILTRLFPVAAIAGVLAVPATGSFRHVTGIGRTDTRTLAREWITANVAPGSVIVTGPFGVAIPRTSATVVNIPFTSTGSEATAPFYDVRWYEDFELIIASDYDLGRYEKEPERFAPMLRYRDELRSRWRLLASFEAGDDSRGPSLWFYAPPSGGRADTLAGDLLNGLSSVGNDELVSQFARNVSGSMYARGKLRKCEQLLDYGLRLVPGDTKLMGTMAYVYFKGGRFDESLAMIERADRAGGSGGAVPELLTLKGNILTQKGDYVAAEAALLKARDQRPGWILPHTLLVGLYSRKGDARALTGALERYLSVLTPGDPEALRVSGLLDSLRSAR
jgi:tetratricopeptide (TPR) repeat protein